MFLTLIPHNSRTTAYVERLLFNFFFCFFFSCVKAGWREMIFHLPSNAAPHLGSLTESSAQYSPNVWSLFAGFSLRCTVRMSGLSSPAFLSELGLLHRPTSVLFWVSLSLSLSLSLWHISSPADFLSHPIVSPSASLSAVGLLRRPAALASRFPLSLRQISSLVDFLSPSSFASSVAQFASPEVPVPLGGRPPLSSGFVSSGRR